MWREGRQRHAEGKPAACCGGRARSAMRQESRQHVVEGVPAAPCGRRAGSAMCHARRGEVGSVTCYNKDATAS